MWEELGGNKIPVKKQVHVNIPQQNIAKQINPQMPQHRQIYNWGRYDLFINLIYLEYNE